MLAGDVALGEIAVAKAPDGDRFDEVDQALLEELAAHTVVALRWAEEAEQGRERAALRQQVVDTARHDIRTPIGAGKGFAQLLQSRRDRMAPEQVETALAGIVESFTRIEAFSTRLLLDDRALTPGVEPQWDVLQVGDLLEAVRRDACASVGRDDAVTVHCSDDAPATLAGDVEMVRQVLDNLVGNALKHAGSAAVTARAEGEQVRFDVRDEGPGIPEEQQARLFERWTRAPGTRADGFGLGLAIVKRLVVAHGGLLGISSRPGEGSTFWVTFPRTAPTAVVRASPRQHLCGGARAGSGRGRAGAARPVGRAYRPSGSGSTRPSATRPSSARARCTGSSHTWASRSASTGSVLSRSTPSSLPRTCRSVPA